MANETVLKKTKFKAGSRYFTSGDARAYQFIHFSKSSNCITEFSELTRTPSRKYIYFWKAMINTAAKKGLVQLCYYMTREFSSTFSRINFQQKSVSNLLKSRAAVSVKRIGISTALRRHFR